MSERIRLTTRTESESRLLREIADAADDAARCADNAGFNCDGTPLAMFAERLRAMAEE